MNGRSIRHPYRELAFVQGRRERRENSPHPSLAYQVEEEGEWGVPCTKALS